MSKNKSNSMPPAARGSVSTGIPYSDLSNYRLARVFRELDRALARAQGFAGLATLVSEHTSRPVHARDLFRAFVAGLAPEQALAIDQATGTRVHGVLCPWARMTNRPA